MVEGDDFVEEFFFLGDTCHAVDGAGKAVLCDGIAAGDFDVAQADDAVLAHAGHDDGEYSRPVSACEGGEKDIGGGAVEKMRGFEAEAYVGHAAIVTFDDEMSAVGGEIDDTGRDQVSILGDADFEGTEVVETLNDTWEKTVDDVLDDEDGNRETAGDRGKKPGERLGAAGGDGKSDGLETLYADCGSGSVGRFVGRVFAWPAEGGNGVGERDGIDADAGGGRDLAAHAVALERGDAGGTGRRNGEDIDGAEFEGAGKSVAT